VHPTRSLSNSPSTTHPACQATGERPQHHSSKHHQQLRRNSDPVTALISNTFYLHLRSSRALSPQASLENSAPQVLSPGLPTRPASAPQYAPPSPREPTPHRRPPVPISEKIPEPSTQSKTQSDRTRALARYLLTPGNAALRRIASQGIGRSIYSQRQPWLHHRGSINNQIDDLNRSP
jgi:hypothetical protein